MNKNSYVMLRRSYHRIYINFEKSSKSPIIFLERGFHTDRSILTVLPWLGTELFNLELCLVFVYVVIGNRIEPKRDLETKRLLVSRSKY